MKRILLGLLALVWSAGVWAQPPCYYGIPKPGWESLFPRWGYEWGSGVLWAAWMCYPVNLPDGSLAAPPGVFVLLGGPLSFNTFGPRLQTIRTSSDPALAADTAWKLYVKADAKTDPVLKPIWERETGK